MAAFVRSTGSGETLWDRPFGSARANGPRLARHSVQYRYAQQWRRCRDGRRTAVHCATTDNLIRAIDVETGETVWTDVLPGGGQ